MSKIEVVDYRLEWPAEFEAIAGEIRSALGSDAVRIDHIGSTAVPRLAAKDIIDIQVSVADINRNSNLVHRLKALGYDFRTHIKNDNLVGVESSSPELQKIFFRQPKGQRPANVHVREEGRLNQLYALLFRDFLRADTFVRSAYESVKRELARRFADDVDAYYAIKDPYMDTVYRAALLWKDATSWKPDGN